MDLEELKRHGQQHMNVLPHPQACLLPLIRFIANSESEVTGEMQAALAQICDVPLDHVRSLVLALHRPDEPPGAIRVCRDLICALNGARELFDALQTSGIPSVVTGCFGYCYAAPAVQKPDGKFYQARVGRAVDKPSSPRGPALVTMHESAGEQGDQE